MKERTNQKKKNRKSKKEIRMREDYQDQDEMVLIGRQGARDGSRKPGRKAWTQKKSGTKNEAGW